MDAIENYLIFYIAICSPKFLTPDRAAIVYEHGPDLLDQDMTAQDANKIQKLRDKGCTWVEIGRALGLSHSTVFYRWRKYNTKIGKEVRLLKAKYTMEQRIAVWEDYKSGMSWREVGAKHNLTPENALSISKSYFERKGIPL